MIAICPAAVMAQDVFFLGETHDNPGHHVQQAERVAALKPMALVFEMLTREQAEKVTDELRLDAEALSQALEWEQSGWPDFAMYFPIFESAPGAKVFGAGLPRRDVMRLMKEPVEEVFGPSAEEYGLTIALPKAQQDAREEMQLAAHCNALPIELLPEMVGMQRLRDAALARAVVQAIDATGGPVVVITGNGHARKDWGAPVYLAKRAPDLEIYALGQGEEGAVAPAGEFDEISYSPPAEREDPCNAFK
ncbi:ChaN family lipoprotein [Pelagimonas phthalicica]|nr:ChaN family lipoprotein [Pelagimonas phthalicica]